MARRSVAAHCHRMLRRTIALVLWAYFAWYLVAMVANATGLTPALGPLAGLAMAVFAAYDWRRPRSTPRPAPAKELQLSR
jgi:hypothetical protein